MSVRRCPTRPTEMPPNPRTRPTRKYPYKNAFMLFCQVVIESFSKWGICFPPEGFTQDRPTSKCRLSLRESTRFWRRGCECFDSTSVRPQRVRCVERTTHDRLWCVSRTLRRFTPAERKATNRDVILRRNPREPRQNKLIARRLVVSGRDLKGKPTLSMADVGEDAGDFGDRRAPLAKWPRAVRH